MHTVRTFLSTVRIQPEDGLTGAETCICDWVLVIELCVTTIYWNIWIF
jgi:hypothetical protein